MVSRPRPGTDSACSTRPDSSVSGTKANPRPARMPWAVEGLAQGAVRGGAHGRRLVDGADPHNDGTSYPTGHHLDRSAAAENLGVAITNRA